MGEKFLEKWTLHYKSRTGLVSSILNWTSDRKHILSNYLKDVPTGSKILDFGCGSGYNSFFLEKELDMNIIGVDVSGKAIDFAVHEKRKNNSNCEFLLADCQRLPFKNASFDAIFSSDVFGHFTNIEDAIGEIERILKKKGTAAILSETNGYLNNKYTWQYYVIKKIGKDPWIEHDLHISLHSKNEIYNMLNNSGLTVIKKNYYVRNHILFNFIEPRPEIELYGRYPLLKRFGLVKITEIFVNFHNMFGKLIPFRAGVMIISAIVSRTLMKLVRRDYGGIFLKLKKM